MRNHSVEVACNTTTLQNTECAVCCFSSLATLTFMLRISLTTLASLSSRKIF